MSYKRALRWGDHPIAILHCPFHFHFHATHRILLLPLALQTWNQIPIFNVVIAYEDFETGKTCEGTYDFLVNNLRHECRFENQMWKFDVLGNT